MDSNPVPKGPSLHHTDLNHIIATYENDFKTLLTNGNAQGDESKQAEFGFVIYADSTGKLARSKSKKGTKESVSLDEFLTPDNIGADHVPVAAFHIHPGAFVSGCAPSGIGGSKPGDVQLAQKPEYKGIFFLVATFVTDKPPKKFAENAAPFVRSIHQFSSTIRMPNPQNPNTTVDKNWQLWIVYNDAAKKADF